MSGTVLSAGAVTRRAVASGRAVTAAAVRAVARRTATAAAPRSAHPHADERAAR